MQRKGGPRIFPLIITIIVVALIIAAIVSIGRAIFGNTSSDTEKADTSQDQLLSTEDGRSVRLKIRGHIINTEDFKTYQVDVSPERRTLTTFKGYQNDVQDRKSFGNNQKAYEEFVYALRNANMMKGSEDPEKDDLRGICANGDVYEYSILNYGEVEKRLWTSTCGGSKGTLDASVDQLNDLFQDQIPKSEDMEPFATGNGLKLQY